MRTVASVRSVTAALVLCVAVAGCARSSSLSRSGNDSVRSAVGHPALTALLAQWRGREHLQSLDDWLVEGSGRENLSAELQGVQPDRPTWRAHYESFAMTRNPERAAWTRRSLRNDSSTRDRRIVLGMDSSGSIDFVTGQGAMVAGGDVAGARRRWRRRLPHLLVLEAATASQCRERASSTAVLELDCRFMADSAEITLSVDRRDTLLSGMQYLVAIPGMGPQVFRWRWPAWREDSTLGAVPLRHSIEIGSRIFQQVEYEAYGATQSRARPAVSVASPASRPAPEALLGTGPDTGLVANGVHVLNVEGFRVMVVEFVGFLLLADAPEAHPATESVPPRSLRTEGYVAQALRAQLRARFANKPLRYIVLSHHHSDHLGGLGGVADSNTIVLAAPGHVAAARRALSVSTPMARGPAVRVQSVPARRVVSDGMMRVEVLNVGRNPHTDENLIVWVPGVRVLFQGDLFYFQANAPFPPSGRATMNRFFASWLTTHGIAPRVVFGAHNRGGAGADVLARARR